MKKNNMNKISLTYTLSQSLVSLFRNSVMSIASILVLASCLLVLGTFGLLITNINYNLEDLTRLNEVAAFVENDCSEDEIENIRLQILSLTEKGYINDVSYLSKEDALQSEMTKFQDYPGLFESLRDGDNPYRASFVITYTDETILSDLEYDLYNIQVQREGETVYPVDKVTSHADVASMLSTLKEGITEIFVGFMLILFVVSMFIIINTIRLAVFARRKEISIMRYVGATNRFIIAPFVMEGVFMGLVAAIGAFFVEWIVYSRICSFVSTHYRIFSVVSFGENALYMILAFLGIGLLAGVAGSLISLSKYLKED
jgi:cell division transport system permease protein